MMKVLRRLTASVSASVDQAVAHMENHDAVVAAALRDARHAGAQAKVRLARVQRDGQALQAKIAELAKQEAQWRKRAKASAAEDEQKALECVARMRACEQQQATLRESLAHHQTQLQKLEATSRKIDARIVEIEQQRQLLRTRQSSADAHKLVTELDQSHHNDLDDVLERWETSILSKEYAVPEVDLPDSFDQAFEQEETQVQLRSTLSDLLAIDEQPKSEDRS